MTRRSVAARPPRWGALVLLLPVAGCASVVQGTPVAGEAPAALVPVESGDLSLRVEYETTLEEVNDYWTAERQEDAVPLDPVLPEDTGLVGGDSPTGVMIDPTGGAPAAGESAVPDTDAGDLADAVESPAHGRLYMSFPTGDAVCSATVVSSAGRDLVVTAGHCVWDTYAGEMATNVMFVPEDAGNGAERPYGAWVVSRVLVPQQFSKGATSTEDGYIVGDGWAYDFAFLELAPDEKGRLIEDVTGGQGIAFGIPVDELVVIGYPSADAFDGTSQRYCASGAWSPEVYAYSIECVMTPGSSGGGWLTRFDPQARTGYVVGTSSFSDGYSLSAAPLGAVALDLYTEAGES